MQKWSDTSVCTPVHYYNVRTSHSNWHRAQWKGFARSAQLAWFNVAQVQLVQQKWQDTCSIDLHRMHRWMVVISSILPGVSNIWSSATQTIDPCRACTVVPGDGLRHKRQRLFSDDVQWISWYLPTVSGLVRLGTTGIVIRRPEGGGNESHTVRSDGILLNSSRLFLSKKKWWDGETELSSGAPPRPYTGPYKMYPLWNYHGDVRRGIL